MTQDTGRKTGQGTGHRTQDWPKDTGQRADNTGYN